MCPSTVSPATKSSAEKRLFNRIRDELSDDWVVLHSLGLTSHPTKPWAEIDFVLIGPPGVFCLEVKGGRIERSGGQWIYIDRYGHRNSKRESPFEQVKSASMELRRWMLDPGGISPNVLCGHGVATPDITLNVTAPDVDLDVLYDVRDANQPVSVYMDRLANHWREKIARLRTAPARPLTKSEVNSILELLRGDFQLRVAMRRLVSIAGSDLVALTSEQFGVLDGLAENERAIVSGGAGTGKTLLAIEEAKRSAERGDRVLFCCFNRLLAKSIRRELAGSSDVTVENLHGLMRSLISGAGLDNKIPDAEPQDLFQVFFPELTLEAVLESEDPDVYDVLIVDEAQDLLRDSYLDVLDSLLEGGLGKGRWRVFLDPNQDIFAGIQPQGMERMLSFQPARFRLRVNCRNTRPIAVETQLVSGVLSNETLVVDGPKVHEDFYSDERDERRLLTRYLNRLLSDGIRPAEITILSRRKMQNSCLPQVLGQLHAPIADVSDEEVIDLDGSIRFSTIQAFKGMESDVIAIVDVDDLRSSDALSAMYVGTSRARALLALFISESARSDYEMKAREFGLSLAASE